MKRYLSFILVIAVTLSFACNLTTDLADQITPDPPGATVAADAPEATVAAAQPGDPTQPTAPSTDSPTLFGDYAGLTSYRSRAVVTDQETGQREEMSSEVIVEPFAMRMTMEMGEMIMTGAGVWMELPGGDWYQMDFTAEELTMSREQFMALEWGGDLDELPDIPPWPSHIVFMPDQASLSVVEGGLTPAGRDNVNGIPCQQYNLVTDYSYEVSDAMAGDDVSERMQAAGVICVADQANLPAMIIWADIEQTVTRVIAEREVVWQHRVEYEVTAINAPITIEPPADAMSLDDMYGDWNDGDFDDMDVIADDLSELDSYRLVIAIHVNMEGYETTRTTTFEWVREPRAYRYVEDMGDFSMEWVGVGDKAWMRMGGSDWMAIQADEAPEFPLSAVEWIDDGEMEWVGTAVVNGIRCNHYRFEIAMPSITSHSDVWVADQPGLPVVVVRSLTQMDQQGQTTTTEVNLYDMNQPLTIEPPR